MVINIILSPEKESLMDMNEAAAYLRLCSVKFKQLVNEADIPYVQYPGMKKRLYRREDLEKFIDDNRIKPVKFDIDEIPVVNSPKKPNKISSKKRKIAMLQELMRKIN
jgi:hypothetical protein